MTLLLTPAEQKNGSKAVSLPYDHLLKQSASVASDSMVDITAIDVSQYKDITLQIINESGVNGLTYNVLATADENFDVEAGSDGTCVPLLDSDVSVAANGNDSAVLTVGWKYIFVQMKRTTSGQDATATIHAMGRK